MHEHQFVADITPNQVRVYCILCAVKFKPDPQTIPWNGHVPEKYK